MAPAAEAATEEETKETEVKRSPSKKAKRISAFHTTSFFGKKEKAVEKPAEETDKPAETAETAETAAVVGKFKISAPFPSINMLTSTQPPSPLPRLPSRLPPRPRLPSSLPPMMRSRSLRRPSPR